MRQRKILDINSKLSAEALIDVEGKIELNLKVGTKDYRIAGDEVKQLRDWLTKEVIGDMSSISSNKVDIKTTTSVTPSGIIIPSGLSASGPLKGTSGQAIPIIPLEERRAVSLNPKKYNPAITSVPDTNIMHNGRPLKMEVQDMSGNIEGAKEAFSPDNLNKPEPL